MKSIKILTLILPFAIALAWSGCSDEYDAVIKVSTSQIAFDSGGGEKTVTVATDQDQWTVTITGENASHFDYDVDGDELTVIATENTTEEVLSARIVINAGNASYGIQLVQNGKYSPAIEPFLNIVGSGESIGIRYVGGDMVLEIDTNSDWNVALESEWLSLTEDKQNNKLILTAAQNETNGRLNALVPINYGPDYAESVNLNVIQYTRDEDAYYSLVGRWALYCNDWEFGDVPYNENEPVTKVSCSILADEYDSSFNMYDLFLDGAVQFIMYDSHTDEITIPLGWPVRISGTYYYMVAVNLATGNFGATELKGKISDDRRTIDLTGIQEGWGIGVIGYYVYTGQYVKFSDLWYTSTSTNLKLVKTSGQGSGTNAPPITEEGMRLPADFAGIIETVSNR